MKIGEGKPGPGRPKGPKRRRAHVTLNDETWTKLDALSERLGQPVATLIAEVVQQGLPALDITVQALDLAQSAPREAQRLLANYGADAVMKLQQQQLEFDAAVTKKQEGARRGRTT